VDRIGREEIEQQRVADVGFLDEKPVRRAGHDRELPIGNTLIQLERVLEIHLVIVADHHECSTTNRRKIVMRQSRPAGMHREQFSLERRRSFVRRDEHAWSQPSV